MIFGSIDLRQYFKIKNIKKGMLPPIENITQQRSGRDGVTLRRTKIKPRSISAEIEIKGSSKENLNIIIRHLANTLYTPNLNELRFPDELDKFYMAKLEGDTDLDEILYYGNTMLNFICPDPIAYGQLRKVEFENRLKAYNKGTYQSLGIIIVEIIENMDHLKVTLLNTGEFLYLEDNFISGDIVVIDLEEEYIAKNGYSLMSRLYLESDFFPIPVGEFEILVSSGNVTLEYRERWL